MGNEPCFSKDQLELWLEGFENETISSHVKICSHCQQQLELICHDEELKSPIRHKLPVSDHSESPACRAVVQKLQQISVSDANDTLRFRKTPSVKDRDYHPFQVGDWVDQYQVTRQIGQGGMATVYEAVDRSLHRSVALKFLLSTHFSKDEFTRFQREASVLASVPHHNVVSIYGFQENTHNGLPYLVMELVHGPSLQSWIRSNSHRPERIVASWIASIADGLSAAHRIGVIHRDIKPGNILLAQEDQRKNSGHSSLQKANNVEADWVPKLADFGLAREEQTDSRLTQSGILTGTPVEH
jgi:eukaryotic-like serine/threonine-protein kinase